MPPPKRGRRPRTHLVLSAPRGTVPEFTEELSKLTGRALKSRARPMGEFLAFGNQAVAQESRFA